MFGTVKQDTGEGDKEVIAGGADKKDGGGKQSLEIALLQAASGDRGITPEVAVELLKLKVGLPQHELEVKKFERAIVTENSELKLKWVDTILRGLTLLGFVVALGYFMFSVIPGLNR